MKRLLILACSATKAPDPEPIRARDRYRGPLWLTLKNADPHGLQAHTFALSAKHGLLDADALLEDYDQQMTDDAAARLRGRLDVADAVLRTWPFDDVAVCAGVRYLDEFAWLRPQMERNGAIAREARWTIINGAIGQMRRELRVWLRYARTEPNPPKLPPNDRAVADDAYVATLQRILRQNPVGKAGADRAAIRRAGPLPIQGDLFAGWSGGEGAAPSQHHPGQAAHLSDPRSGGEDADRPAACPEPDVSRETAE